MKTDLKQWRSCVLTHDDIKKYLKQNKHYMQEHFKVKEIGIFGSYVHGIESDESDVDILVEFYEDIGWEFIDFKEYLENLLGKHVDLVTINALKKQFKNEILEEVMYI